MLDSVEQLVIFKGAMCAPIVNSNVVHFVGLDLISHQLLSIINAGELHHLVKNLHLELTNFFQKLLVAAELESGVGGHGWFPLFDELSIAWESGASCGSVPA